ncbi:hypothetical protein, partial [Serratia marcescens]|uniref:hypothetical protein n=1 Tax=Serratia marcescens TaxID=615 RepID=UPI0011E94187
EIAADFSYETVRLSDRVLSWTWNRLYQGINVTNAERVRQLAHALGVGDVDALIQPVPGPAQHAVGQAHGFVGEIGGDL